CPDVLSLGPAVSDLRLDINIVLKKTQRPVSGCEESSLQFLVGDAEREIYISRKMALEYRVVSGGGVGIFDNVTHPYVFQMNDRRKRSIVEVAVHALLPLDRLDRGLIGGIS